MSGPVSPPLATTESGTSTIVRPTNTLEFNGADFTVTGSGSKATISIDSTGAGAALTRYQIGYGDASNLLTGSTNLLYDDTVGSELVTIKGSGTSDLLKLESTDTSSSAAPDLVLYRGAPGAASDFLGNIIFRGQNNAGTDEDYAFIQSFIQDADPATAEGTAGMMLFKVVYDSSNKEVVRFNKAGIQANVNNESVFDFRFDGTLDNLIFADSSGNNVGIGTTPDSDAKFHIKDDGTEAATLRIESTDTDADSGPVIEFFRNSASPAAGDDLGYVNFTGENASGSKVSYAAIRVDIDDTTASGEDASLNFLVTSGGSSRKLLRARYSEVVVNEDSDDVNFRVEGNGDVNLFVADAGMDKVGIGELPDSNGAKVQIDVGNSTTRALDLISDDGDANGSPIMRLNRNSSSPAVGDNIGQIEFVGKDDGGNATTYAQIKASIQDETGGTEDGWLQFGAAFAGTLQPNMLTIRGDVPAVVINEGSGDIDFRVESNSNANMFKVDGGLNLVGVGAAPVNPGATLQIPDNTISHYCNVNSIRSDAVGLMVMVNEDNQGQMWVHESSSAHTLQLVEGGVKGQHFQFMSTDGNITIDPQGSDTLNGGTGSLLRSTNYEIYDVFCYDTGKWALSNPA